MRVFISSKIKSMLSQGDVFNDYTWTQHLILKVEINILNNMFVDIDVFTIWSKESMLHI